MESKYAVTSQSPPSSSFIERPKSIQDRIEQWYLIPLSKMRDHEGFICLEICFVLYEKYLRASGKIGERERFSEGHKVFNQIGNDFSISADIAYEFWNHWRNGLLHRGMPNTNSQKNFGMTQYQERPIEVSGNQISINPWKFRDQVIKIIRSNKAIWRDDDFPLAREFEKML